MAAARLWGAALLLAGASLAAAKCGVQHTDTMHLQRLRKDLLCRYTRDIGPNAGSTNKTDVRPMLLRTRFDVDEKDSTMQLVGYMMFVWKDQSLGWEPPEYGNVTRVYVDASQIWTPVIATIESPSKALGGDGQALIMNGTVYWTMHKPLRAPCRHDGSRWPYDLMVCSLTLLNQAMDFSRLETRAMSLHFLKWGNNHGWSMSIMIRLRGNKKNQKESVRLEFTLNRHVGKHEAATVWAVGLQPVLLVASVGLPADSPHRPLLLCALALVQVLLCTAVPANIAVVGNAAPGVLLLLRDLLVVTGVAILEWTWARWMLSRPQQPPAASSLDALLDLADKLSVVLVLPGPGAPKAARTVALAERVFNVLLIVLCATLMARLLPTAFSSAFFASLEGKP